MDNSLHFSSGDNQHYTPYSFLIKVIEFYKGNIDLDPCSNSLSNPHVPASMHYTEELNGLNLPWFGKVFVNPPYSRKELKPFVEKCIVEHEQRNTADIVLLVPSRTDTQWHKLLKDYPRCYLSGRLKFHNPKNKNNSAPFPSAVFYLGSRNEEFQKCFKSMGEVFNVPVDSDKSKKEIRKKYMREYMRRKRNRSGS